MRLFNLVRDEDESGVSGTGIVAQGVEFDNGKVAMSWLSHMQVVHVWDSITALSKTHGHGGKTKVVWIHDTDPADAVPEEVEENGKTKDNEDAQPSV